MQVLLKAGSPRREGGRKRLFLHSTPAMTTNLTRIFPIVRPYRKNARCGWTSSRRPWPLPKTECAKGRRAPSNLARMRIQC